MSHTSEMLCCMFYSVIFLPFTKCLCFVMWYRIFIFLPQVVIVYNVEVLNHAVFQLFLCVLSFLNTYLNILWCVIYGYIFPHIDICV